MAMSMVNSLETNGMVDFFFLISVFLFRSAYFFQYTFSD